MYMKRQDAGRVRLWFSQSREILNANYANENQKFGGICLFATFAFQLGWFVKRLCYSHTIKRNDGAASVRTKCTTTPPPPTARYRRESFPFRDNSPANLREHNCARRHAGF